MMDRRNFLGGVLAGLVGASGVSRSWAQLAGAVGGDSPSRRPNIVFILVDDMRWDSMGCAGHPFVKTPNIDRLAREGAMFRTAMVTTPLCSPSRASFYTGLYPHSHGIVGNEAQQLRNFRTDNDLVGYASLLQKAGYETAHIGKWHMENHDRPRPGFDYWVSFRGQGKYHDQLLNDNGNPRQSTGYLTDVINEEAVNYIRREHTKPFVMNVWHKAVHGPFTPADRHRDLYTEVTVEPPSNADATAGSPILDKPGRTAPPFERHRTIMLEQLRCIAAIDEGVGKILDALEETGVLDNTLVVFSSDNGYFWGEHGLVDKRAAYDESVRVPLLMRYPGVVRPGMEIDAQALNIDLAPTFLELAGTTLPPDTHGRSLVPLLEGSPSLSGRDAVLLEYFQEAKFPLFPDWQAVRTDEYKLVVYTTLPDAEELYDLKNDPTETINLVSNPAYAPVRAMMRRHLKALREQTQAPDQLPEPLPT